MSKRQWVRISKKKIPYEGIINALSDGFCPELFVSQAFVKEDTVHICYEVTGFQSLRVLTGTHLLSEEDAVNIIWKILCLMDGCRNWLWFPDEYVISLDTVWIDNKGNLKLMWIPDGEKISEMRRLKNFICRLKGRVSATAVERLEQISKFLDESYGRDGEIKWFFDELLTEIKILNAV